ncbi:hypothetical protein [Kineococcus arenarius]|uniref:hypothetical protein n=1 Tax=unclassified Kineococcus TaxID=2621656 RepID=UPI003D7DF9E7
MRESEQSRTVDRLRESIDAVLVPRGFAAGQAGVSDGQRQITWCAAADDFAARFPGLPVGQEPPEGWGATCTDVVVDVAIAGGDWCLTGVDVEGHSLERLFAGLGLTATAGRAAALIGSTAHECLASLPPLLIDLLDGSNSKR